jgi:general secretion pathway protein N
MTAFNNLLGLVAGLTLVGASAASAAAPTLDVPSPGIAGSGGITILETDRPAPIAAKQLQPKGNPLWAIPLSKLTATRERPIFLPSRRPPAPVIANVPTLPPRPVVAPPEEKPRFALVGAVSGENEAIAVFVDQATKNVIRLRTGQNHDGWVLSSVKGRAATLQKNQKTLVFNLPAPGSSPLAVTDGGAPGVLSAATAAALPSPAASSNLVVPDPTVAAPFIPRSTPKHGEPDGL